ncbi:MAG: FAD-dependent oxidoreductase, partial [Oscillospiraceae bacterium]|nr:FAD-dependent oxidoreductase [Oscillospiraceae bacterium]
YLKWMRHTAAQCVKRGARIYLNLECTKDMLDKEGYDAVVIAVGAEPIVPKRIPGIDKPHVSLAPDAELGNAPVGDNIVIVGAGQVGLEAALDFAKDGKKVTVIEMTDAMTAMMKGGGNGDFNDKLREYNVVVKYDTALAEVKDDCVAVKDTKSGNISELPCDTVLLAMGIKPRLDVVDALRHSCPETSVAIVGDCNNKAGTIAEAVNQAFQACIHI